MAAKMAQQEGLRWKPYEESILPIIPHLRWKLLSPLQVRIPRTGFTLGEALVMFLTIIFFGVNAATLTGAEASGGLAVLPFALAFATASHNSIFTFFLGLPFERALFWHKYFAIWSAFLGTTHGIIAGMGDGEAMTGLVATVLAGVMLFAFFEPLRRQAFELFYYLHWVIFLIILFALLLHEAGGVMFGAGLWLIDVFIRYVYMACLKHGHEATIEALPADVIKITIPRGDFNYRAGQYCFICIPELSLFEWHPFSISTSPFNDDGNFTLHVRALGNWTNALKALAKKKTNINIYYEGPYGEPQIDFESDRYKLFLLVSGGIGITPMQSICNQLSDEYARGRPIELCYFVWSCRDKEMVDSVALDQSSSSNNKEKDISDNSEDPSKNGLPLCFQPDIIQNVGLNKDISNASFKITPKSAWSSLSSVSPSDKDIEKNDKEEDKDNSSQVFSVGPFHTEYYLTRAKNESEFAGIHTTTKNNLKLGRPNIEHIFATMKTIALEKGINKVAVLTCGPTPLVQSVISQAELHSNGGVTFDLHMETFAF